MHSGIRTRREYGIFIRTFESNSNSFGSLPWFMMIMCATPRRVGGNFTTIPQLFRENGYRTLGMGKVG